jgi:hypothetical protein
MADQLIERLEPSPDPAFLGYVGCLIAAIGVGFCQLEYVLG